MRRAIVELLKASEAAKRLECGRFIAALSGVDSAAVANCSGSAEPKRCSQSEEVDWGHSSLRSVGERALAPAVEPSRAGTQASRAAGADRGFLSGAGLARRQRALAHQFGQRRSASAGETREGAVAARPAPSQGWRSAAAFLTIRSRCPLCPSCLVRRERYRDCACV